MADVNPKKRHRDENVESSEDEWGPAIPKEVKQEESSDDDWGPEIPANIVQQSTTEENSDNNTSKVHEEKITTTRTDNNTANNANTTKKADIAIGDVTEAQLQVYADDLPSGLMYEKSYMHKDVVTHTVVAPGKSEFIITGSADGCIKFWQKVLNDVTFVKVYKAHLGQIVALVASHDGMLLASVSDDSTVKYFDIKSFDMTTLSKLSFQPYTANWVSKKGAIKHILAVSDRHSPNIFLLDGDDGMAAPLHKISFHTSPVLCIEYNAHMNAVISADAKGVIEYWSTDADRQFKAPAENIEFTYKSNTDLFAIAKAKAYPTSINVHPKGNEFVVSSTDGIVRIFDFSTGKIRTTFNESIESSKSSPIKTLLNISDIEFENRLVQEGEYMKHLKQSIQDRIKPLSALGPSMSTNTTNNNNNENNNIIPFIPSANAIYDQTGFYLLICTPLGIKVICLGTNRLTRILGTIESTEKFLALSLYQGIPHQSSQMESALSTKKDPLFMSSLENVQAETDPTLFCTSYNRHRFYMFTKREPIVSDEEETTQRRYRTTAVETRDVMNEPPSKAEIAALSAKQKVLESKKASGIKEIVVMTTEKGEIWLELFPEDAPKACENFLGLIKRNYYDNCQFFRVIKGFMIQTGDPTNSGTGGQSIWKKDFEDEIVPKRKFTVPGLLAMANAGPNTNGSQFFITGGPASWLNGKHTIFGKVVRGFDVIQDIESGKTNPKNDRPIEPCKILNVAVREQKM